MYFVMFSELLMGAYLHEKNINVYFPTENYKYNFYPDVNQYDFVVNDDENRHISVFQISVGTWGTVLNRDNPRNTGTSGHPSVCVHARVLMCTKPSMREYILKHFHV